MAVGTRRIRIAPSLLAADLARAGDEARRVQAAGADLLHLDLLDGHFAPNLTFGPAFVAAVHKACDIPMSAHLMLTNPERFVGPLAEAGVGELLFHPEGDINPRELARTIRDLGARPGVALTMQTPPEQLSGLEGDIDAILVMTVKCGHTGQTFHPAPTRKIPALREMFGEDIDIAVDGGVSPENAEMLAALGANVFVAGKGIFWTDDPARAIRDIRAAAEAAFAGT